MKPTLVALAVLWLGMASCGESSRTPDAETAQVTPPPSANGGASVAEYQVGARPRAVAVADLNGDGRLDVAVANAGGGTVTVLFGDGSGRLLRPASFPAGKEPSDVDLADLDRDGDADLVVANHETSNITVFSNDGRGRFTRAPGSPVDTGARPHLHGLATGDFDGDGWPDVAVESSDTKEICFLRGGPRGFAAPQAVAVGTMPYSRLGVGDVTGDGRPEILVPGHRDNTVRWVESVEGAPRASAPMIRVAGQPWMIVAGDLNGDERDDLVVVQTDSVSVWLAGAGGFAEAPYSPRAVAGATEAAIGDLDGDGVADLAIGPWDGDEVTVVLGGAAVARRVRMCERPFGLAIADLDGDGRGELLATCGKSNELTVTTVVSALSRHEFTISPPLGCSTCPVM